jgi:hypothetical protein
MSIPLHPRNPLTEPPSKRIAEIVRALPWKATPILSAQTGYRAGAADVLARYANQPHPLDAKSLEEFQSRWRVWELQQELKA